MTLYGIPLYQFDHKERKDDVANRIRQQRGVRNGIVFIGVGQEKAQGFQGKKIGGRFEFTRDKTVYVNHYYFYINDADFGPVFLKVCSYAPWGTKLCLNGHEWAKRQLEKKGIAYEALDNGFLSCAEPKKLQQVCDSLGPEDIDRLFRKWLKRLPLPLRPEDRAAGYDWSLSIWQLAVSLTQIFDQPLRGREFFKEIIRDDLDLGRPDRVQLIFDRVVTKKTPGLSNGGNVPQPERLRREQRLTPSTLPAEDRPGNQSALAGSRTRQPQQRLERRQHPTGGATRRDRRWQKGAGTEVRPTTISGNR
jgi:hypothetical protein